MKTKMLFGTDGVRGKANSAPMEVETALALGRAAAMLMRRHNGKHRVVVGKDTRLSCYMFENALIAGLNSMGVDTLMVGPLPTPGVAFITRAYRADAGIVISASHNPFYDNGIKFFDSQGFKFPDSWEEEVEQAIANREYLNCLPAEDDIGKNARVHDADGRYIEFVKGTFPRNTSLKGFKVALDCANGAAHRVAPMIFRELDAKVFVFGAEPDGLNINKGCGSLHPELVQKAVLEQGANIGIALDGDADRVIMVDENGQIVDGDLLLALCALDMKKRGQLNRVVGTIMTNLGVQKALQEEGIEMITSKVGDRYVIKKMLEHKTCLGGEQSGHLIFLNYNTTGDGLVTALQVLRIMKESGEPLSNLVKAIPRFPQTLLNVPVLSKPPLESLDDVQIAIQQVEEQLKNEGRVVVRYSGTENICRVMVEGKNLTEIQKLAEHIANAIQGGS